MNEYISHYETLGYDNKHLHAKHTRARRATIENGDEHHVHLKLTAHGEDLHLRLRRDISTFSDNLEVSSKRNACNRANYDNLVNDTSKNSICRLFIWQMELRVEDN